MKYSIRPLAALLALATADAAQANASTPVATTAPATATSSALATSPATSPAPAKIPTRPGTVLRATLPNGLRVVIVPDRLAPVVTTEISYLVGSNEALAGFPGTAHALEHMMFRGAAGLDRDQLAEIGARIGGSYNAQTTETTTQYFYTAPADDLDVILHIEALRMNGALLRQADWAQERGAIEQEVSRDLSSPAYVYLSHLQAALFAGTPYVHDALGTRASFDKTDAALLRHFYETWYAPNNAVLVIAGDVDPAATLAAVQRLFSPIPRRTLPPRPVIAPKPQPAITLHYDTDYPVSFATIAWRMPGLTARDFAAADLLSDVMSSKRYTLYGLVPDGRALATQFLYEAKADVGFGVAVAAFPKGGDPKPVFSDLQGVIDKVVKSGVPANLVEAAKAKEIAQLAFAPDDVEALARLWSRALVEQGLASPDDIVTAYRHVTAADVDRVARAIFNPAHAVTALLTPSVSGHPITGTGFGGAEQFASPPDHPVPLPDWASTAIARLVLPPPSPPAVVSHLANGLTLIVHPTNVSDTVSVYGMVRNEPALEEPKGQEGVADLAETLFDYGTTHLDRLAFQSAVDAIAGELNAGSSFSLKVRTRDFDRGMQLLADNEIDPALPDTLFPVARRQLAQQAAGQMQSPAWQLQQASYKAILPAGDPQARHATEASVMSITPDELRAYVGRVFRPDLTTIDIVGNVTPDEALKITTACFGGWKSNGPAPDINLPTVPPNGPSSAYVADHLSLQTEVKLIETLDAKVTDPDRVPLDLGDQILGGGFSSRLYRDLRIKSGDVYSVQSRLDWQRTRANYSITYGLDASRAAQARAMAIADIADMQAHPVSANELDLAKAGMLRRLPLRRASADDIGAQDLFLIDRGLPLDQPDRDARVAYATTAADIQTAMSHVIRTKDLAEIVKGPPR